MMTTATPIRIVDIVATHPLYAVLSDASRARIFAGGLPAELVCGYGERHPTAIRYLGEAWPLTGARWADAAPPAAKPAGCGHCGRPEDTCSDCAYLPT